MNRFVRTSLFLAIAFATVTTTVLAASSFTVNLTPGDSATVTCSTKLVSTGSQQQLTLVCATPVATATATAVAPTATPVPPTPTPAAAVSPSGLPYCAHDPTKYHGLVERNADNSIRCTYGHTHNDNPHALDAVLGALQVPEISYPWQTFNATTGALENDAKHRVYKWTTIQNQACIANNAQYSFRNGRLEAHSDGAMGATVRYHSYYLQVQVCDPHDPSYSGTVSVGGWQDYGHLEAPQGVTVPLPSDPVGGYEGNDRRVHGSPSVPRFDYTWYGHQKEQPEDDNAVYFNPQLGLRAEDWGPVDPNNPSAVLFYGGDQVGNGFDEPFHLVGFGIAGYYPGVVNNIMNFDGWVNRYGRFVTNCSVAGLDCIPVHFHNVKVGSYQFRNNEHDALPDERNYDIVVNGKHLIEFPN